MVASCGGTVFKDMLLNERQRGLYKRREDEAQDVISYCMTSRKIEAFPLQVWRGSEGSRKLGFPDFKKIGT